MTRESSPLIPQERSQAEVLMCAEILNALKRLVKTRG